MRRRTARAFLAGFIAAWPTRSCARAGRLGGFLIGVGVATVAVCLLFVTKSVTVKLLPFDNKSEMAVVVDLPEGATLEDTERTLFSIAGVARQLPEIRSIETYAGTPAPFNFNGLVRHYYVRELPELGELHLNLAPSGERARTSHAIALDLRARLKTIVLPAGTVARVVEVPPGPPVMATLLAEVYGPSSTEPPRRRRRIEKALRFRALHRRHRRIRSDSRGRACGSRSIRIASNFSASNSATSMTRSRLCSAAPRSAIRIAAKAATRSRSSSGYRNAICPGASCWPRRRFPPIACPATRPWSSLATSCA